MLLFIAPTNLFLYLGKDCLIPMKHIVKCHLSGVPKNRL